MKDNPYQNWVDIREEVVQRLRSENEALLQRLAEVESRVPATSSSPNSASDAGMVPRSSYELVHQEKLELEAALKQKEKRLLRLQQIFALKSSEFRDAISSILGVKLAFYPNGQIRATSVFDLNASYIFKPESGGTVSLVAQGEGGPEDLEERMAYWVGSEQCIPGFMATVTLECYEASKNAQ